MGLREGNEFTNNASVIAFSLVGFVIVELMTISVQVIGGDATVKFFIAMLQLIAIVFINFLFGKVGFAVTTVMSILKIGLFSYECIVYDRPSAPALLIFAIAAILISLVIQFFLDTIYSRMFRVKNLYNSTRERLLNMSEENRRKLAHESVTKDNKIIAKHDEEVALRQEISNYTTNLDPVTTLPNRTKLISFLEDWIDDCNSMMQSGGGISKNTDQSVHLIYIAVTNADRLLHSVGHRKLDLFIQCVAQRLRDASFPSDIVGRVEAIEFIILSKRNFAEGELDAYCKNLQEVMNNSFRNVDVELDIYSSVGVASFPEDARFSGDLINRAEFAVAAGAASTAGLANSTTYYKDVKDTPIRNNSTMPVTIEVPSAARFEKDSEERKEKIAKLFNGAFDRNEFYMVYQPEYNASKKLVGFEAFLRWENPELGILKASEFMPLAEQTGIIYKLGQFSIESSLKFLSKLNMLNKDLKLSLNFSALELKFGNTPGTLADLLSRYSINPKNVIVDIPEECLISAFETVKPAIGYISSLGVTMNLDNFGRGYSSLNSIPLLPISAIKIDGYFTKEISSDKSAQVITSSIIDIMHEIDICVCATGVGSEEQYEMLRKYGCDYFQGRVLSEPITETEVFKLVTSMEIE